MNSKLNSYIGKLTFGASTRLQFFIKMRQKFREDASLNGIRNYDNERDYFKFKTSSHSLFVETDIFLANNSARK